MTWIPQAKGSREGILPVWSSFLTIWSGCCTIWCAPRGRRRLFVGRLLIVFDLRRVGQSELLQTVLEGAAGHAEEAGRGGDAPSLQESLLEELFLQGLEREAGVRDLDRQDARVSS